MRNIFVIIFLGFVTQASAEEVWFCQGDNLYNYNPIYEMKGGNRILIHLQNVNKIYNKTKKLLKSKRNIRELKSLKKFTELNLILKN